MFAIVRAAQFSPFSALMGYENPQPFFMLFLNVPKMQILCDFKASYQNLFTLAFHIFSR